MLEEPRYDGDNKSERERETEKAKKERGQEEGSLKKARKLREHSRTEYEVFWKRRDKTR